MEETGIYYKDGKVIAESGDVKVYQTSYDTFLEIGPAHTLWALGSEIIDYENQLGNTPFGDCLEIGLGLGVASKFFLTCQKVKTLTTVEINSDVINAYKYLSLFNSNKKHIIINSDGLEYVKNTDKKFDFIFLDFYTLIDDESLSEIRETAWQCKKILRYGGKICGWFDKYTPSIYINEFNRIFYLKK